MSPLEIAGIVVGAVAAYLAISFVIGVAIGMRLRQLDRLDRQRKGPA